MNIGVKFLRSAINRGGAWVMMVDNKELEAILHAIEREKNTTIQAIRCETINDAVKAAMVIKIFNTWSTEQIMQFMKEHKQYPPLI